MAKLIPFKGLRPAQEIAAKVASLPYDVLDSKEARIMAQDNPKSFLHVIKPEIDLDPGISQYDQVVYDKGKSNLTAFINDGTLVHDEKPCYYIYKQIMGDHEQTGLVACASVDEYMNNIVKKHEHTRPDKVNDRVNLMLALEAQTGPIFLAYKQNDKVKALIRAAMETEPVYDFVSHFDIRHIFYLVDDEKQVSEIKDEFDAIPALYIADGHHRSEGAAEYCKRMRAENPDYTGNEEFNFFLTVSFPEDELLILPYNRVVKDLNGNTASELLEKIKSAGFSLEPVSGSFKGPENKNSFGVYLEGKWHLISANESMMTGRDEVGRLDVALLQDLVLNPMLNIQDPRTDTRIKFVGGLDCIQTLEKLVNSGDFAVAFALCPTQMGQVMDVADAGMVMPPKSTWFEPKLLSGMVTHMLGE